MVLLWLAAVAIRVLCTVLVPMTLGCAATYARVNLGFWWGVLLHCLFNIPAILILLLN